MVQLCRPARTPHPAMLIAHISPLAVRGQLALRADLCRDHSSAAGIASRLHRACCSFMETVLVPQSSVRATWVLTPSCTVSPSHSDISCTTTGLQVACVSLLPGCSGMSSLRGMVQQEGSTRAICWFFFTVVTEIVSL